MKRWWVVAGGSSWYIQDLKEAKKVARRYLEASIFEVFNEKNKFLRFKMDGNKLKKI